MRELRGLIWYTMEELMEVSGYQRGTLYNLTTAGILSPPIIGLAGSDYPSQGLYKAVVLEQLQRYGTLKATGMKKCDIIQLMITERVTHEQQLPLLEARG